MRTRKDKWYLAECLVNPGVHEGFEFVPICGMGFPESFSSREYALKGARSIPEDIEKNDIRIISVSERLNVTTHTTVKVTESQPDKPEPSSPRKKTVPLIPVAKPQAEKGDKPERPPTLDIESVKTTSEKEGHIYYHQNLWVYDVMLNPLCKEEDFQTYSKAQAKKKKEE